MELYKDLLEIEIEDEIGYDPPEWYFPANESNSLYICLAKIKYPADDPMDHYADYKESIIEYMKVLPELQDITYEPFFENLEKADEPADLFVIYAASLKEKWTINVFNADTQSKFSYTSDDVTRSIDLVVSGSYFALKMIYV